MTLLPSRRRAAYGAIAIVVIMLIALTFARCAEPEPVIEPTEATTQAPDIVLPTP